MKLKETILSLFKEEKELSPEEIAENIKEVELCLKKIPWDILKKYKESTGKEYIKIFFKTRRTQDGYSQLNKLTAYITPENTINLELNRFWHYETWTFRYLSKWNENSRKHINDFEKIISENDTWKIEISKYKNDIFKLEKKLHDKIRNQEIIAPIKNAIAKVLGKNKKINLEEV